MTILDEIEVALTQKAAHEQRIQELTAPLSAEVEKLNSLILEKRAQLEEHLRRTKSDKVHSTDGKWYFTRSIRHTRVIASESLVSEWLKEHKLFDRYTKLDKVGIASLAKEQDIAGVVVEEKEIFTLKEQGEKVEQVLPTESVREMSDRVRAAKEAE